MRAVSKNARILAKGAGAMLRLAFNRSSWRPEGGESGEEFRFLLSCLPADEAEKVGRFKFFEDKQRALASRLLQVRDTSQ